MTDNGQWKGLTAAEARDRQARFGKNELTPQKKENFFLKVLHIIAEPMFLLLIVAAVIYFILGEPQDGAIMLIFVVGIITIDVVQEWKTDQTLNALKDLSAPHITVIRDGTAQEIPSADLVPGDLMMICEGVKIPADGVVRACADLRVDESSLTGEAEGVWKTAADDGAAAADGAAISDATVSAISAASAVNGASISAAAAPAISAAPAADSEAILAATTPAISAASAVNGAATSAATAPASSAASAANGVSASAATTPGTSAAPPADGASALAFTATSAVPAANGASTLTSTASSTSAITPSSTDPWRRDYCYAGTLVTQGTGTIQVDKIGAATEYGKIGLGVASAPQEDTPLQKQTRRLVKTCAIIAGVLFLLVGLFTWVNLPDHAFQARLTESVLSGVTLAMAMIPEEFPVILTVFLSMGAWRLAKKHSLVRRLPSVETLGAVSVLCVDKTGTITMNRMTVQQTWTPGGTPEAEADLIRTMGQGCETDTYDPMEKAMLTHCEKNGITREDLFGGTLVREYAFTDALKMMGHVWQRDDGLVIAAKGSPERILTLCGLDPEHQKEAEARIAALSGQGLRVIAVAAAHPADAASVPEAITDCHLTLLGLVGLADPPREGVDRDIARCSKAGIRVVMITGDNGVTASAIAGKIGIPHSGHVITGDQLDAMDDDALGQAVRDVSIFSRVVPEHKMRIVRAFQQNGEIVAMTGDGVNDAPALKYADIGIAMGKRGSEVSREAADLILMDDNFSTIVETVGDGRRIYDNIRKAVGYVFTIHIPIAFASLLAPILGVAPASLLLLPLHVVLLEILIDPTCSIVLERQPAEEDIMERPPRNPKETLLSGGLLARSVAQGLAVFAASFGAYYTTLMAQPGAAPAARAMGLTIIMVANLFLVQVNSSDREFAIHSAKRLCHDKVMWAINLGTLALIGVILYSPLSGFLKLAPLSPGQLAAAVGLAAVSVLWVEILKAVQNRRRSRG